MDDWQKYNGTPTTFGTKLMPYLRKVVKENFGEPPKKLYQVKYQQNGTRDEYSLGLKDEDSAANLLSLQQLQNLQVAPQIQRKIDLLAEQHNYFMRVLQELPDVFKQGTQEQVDMQQALNNPIVTDVQFGPFRYNVLVREVQKKLTTRRRSDAKSKLREMARTLTDNFEKQDRLYEYLASVERMDSIEDTREAMHILWPLNSDLGRELHNYLLSKTSVADFRAALRAKLQDERRNIRSTASSESNTICVEYLLRRCRTNNCQKFHVNYNSLHRYLPQTHITEGVGCSGCSKTYHIERIPSEDEINTARNSGFRGRTNSISRFRNRGRGRGRFSRNDRMDRYSTRYQRYPNNRSYNRSRDEQRGRGRGTGQWTNNTGRNQNVNSIADAINFVNQMQNNLRNYQDEQNRQD